MTRNAQRTPTGSGGGMGMHNLRTIDDMERTAMANADKRAQGAARRMARRAARAYKEMFLQPEAAFVSGCMRSKSHEKTFCF